MGFPGRSVARQIANLISDAWADVLVGDGAGGTALPEPIAVTDRAKGDFFLT